MSQPTLYIPHGGGPCFFMEWTAGPRDTWHRMAAWLRSVPSLLPAPPKALLVVSAHWEAPLPTVLASAAPPLLFDYGGFPPETYRLTWPAPGDPALAARVRALLATAGFPTGVDTQRGFDHGVFVPLKVAFPNAEVPTVQLSLQRGLDPLTHIAIGQALAPLRDEGVLIIGSGMSYHNMGMLQREGAREPSAQFDDWIADTVARPRAEREALLVRWSSAPSGRASHPREEHLLPLMVAAGAAGDAPGARVFQDHVLGATVSAVRFG